MKDHHEEKRHGRSKHMPLPAKIFMLIGILTVLYLFITQVLMRVLAMMSK